MQETLAPKSIPVGRIKSFGELGLKYQVGRAVRQMDDGDWMIEVKLLETGESAEYRLTHILGDPDGI
jgi:hypothetical protein